MPFLGDVSLSRRTWAAPAGWSGGVFGKGTPADTTIRGTFRPAPIRLIQLLPDGDRARDPKVLYTTTELQTTSQHDGTPADYVSPDAGTTWYETTDTGEHADSLPASPIAHRKYLCLRVQEADG